MDGWVWRRHGRKVLSLLTATALVMSLLVVPASAIVVGDSYEPDNTMKTASSIAVGEMQDRTMHSVDDVDWVKFDAVAGNGYRIRLNGGLWIEPELYTAEGEWLDLDQWMYKATTSGTVYLRLDCDDEDEWATGDYRVTVADAGPLTTSTVRAKNTSGELLSDIGVESFWESAQDSGYSWGYTDEQGEADLLGVGDMTTRGYLYDDDGDYCFTPFGHGPIPAGAQETTEVVMYRAGSISGTVRDASTDAGLSEIGVSSYSIGEDDTEWLGGARTNASGAYTLEGLPPGNVYIDFYDISEREYTYLDTPYDDPATLPGRDFITLTEGQDATGVNVKMALSGTIGGTITDADTGAPVGGIEIIAEPLFEADSGYLDYSQPKGTYAVKGLVPGNYHLTVQDFWGRFAPQDLGVTVVEATTTTRDFELTMVDGFLRVTGHVRGGVDGTPGLDGIELWMSGDSGYYDEGSSFSTATDADGLYELVTPVLDSGYSMWVDDPNGDWVSKRVTGSSLTVSGALEDVLLERAAKVSGRVVDAAGQPIKWVYLDVYGADPDEDWRDGGWASTGADGRYTLGGLTPGRYYVEFLGIWDDESDRNVQEEYYDNSLSRQGATVLNLVAGDTTVANATMSPSAMIRSDFYVDGRSKLGVTMKVYQKMPNGSLILVDSSTVEMPKDDLYASRLCAGDYMVEYVAEGSTLGWYGNGGALVPQASAKTVHIADSQSHQNVELVLDAAKPIMLDLTATVLGSSSVSLSWHATDAGVMDRYEISRNGVPLATTKGTSLTDTALAGGSTYTYSVVARDVAGNASAPRTTTVTVPIDPTLPVVVQTSSSGSGASASSTSPVAGAKVRLYTMVTNALGTGVSGKTVQLQQLVGGQWTTLGTASPTGVAGQYCYDVAPSAKSIFRFYVVEAGLAGSPYTVYPKVKLAASTSKSTVKVGKYFTVSGSIKPRHKAGSTSVASVKLYRVVKGKPKYVSTLKLKLANSKKDKNASVFSKRVKLSKKGTWKLVVTVKADSQHAITTLTKTVKVK